LEINALVTSPSPWTARSLSLFATLASLTVAPALAAQGAAPARSTIAPDMETLVLAEHPVGGTQVTDDHAATCPIGEAHVSWKGEQVTIADLPESISENVCRALAHWAPWAGGSGYSIAVEDEGRVILVTDGDAKAAERRMQLVTKTVAAFDVLLPAVDHEGSDEDFLAAEWGVGEIVPDGDPVVLFELADVESFGSLLDHMGKEVPRLASWAAARKQGTGFMYDAVLSGAYLEAPPGFEIGKVWRAENELVNRLSRLMLQGRFGNQPHWFKLGVAWNVEHEVMGDLYAFPGRKDFVGVKDHGSWEPELKEEFKKRRKDPLSFNEFGLWQDGTWEPDAAHISWGIVRFLSQHKTGALSSLAEALRIEQKEGARTIHADGSWNLQADYMVPSDRQEAFLLHHCGEDVLAEATKYFSAGKRYKPSKKRRR